MKDGKYVILHIDDDPDALDSMRIILEQNGFIMEEAESAEEGIRKYKKCHPDLIIADLMMEEIDSGINLVKELKLLDNSAPIYLLSCAGELMYTSIDIADLGFAGVLQKPIIPDNILGILRTKLK